MSIFVLHLLLNSSYFLPQTQAAVQEAILQPPVIESPLKKSILKKDAQEAPYFDLPVTYNSKVRSWIVFFQSGGRRDFKRWLDRSTKYIPRITPTLDAMGLPRDLVYLAMIESGFSPNAVSTSAAVGYWQFIKPTATRYGLQVNWWLDERRDIIKSTIAAASYLNDLNKMFNSWYLAASAYNMGEGRMRNLIKKHKTENYWILSKAPDFPKETAEYIPKLIAAMLIAKAPALYGFNDLTPEQVPDYVYIEIPGGTDLENLAYYVGADKALIKKLNPELIKGFIPQFVNTHRIRIPRHTMAKANEYIREVM
jgi:membrane-bound lytic murein transglycosylase D